MVRLLPLAAIAALLATVKGESTLDFLGMTKVEQQPHQEVWHGLLGGRAGLDAFFSEVYQQRMHIFESSPSLLSPVDAWTSELQEPNKFMTKYWDSLLVTDGAASLRNNKGKEISMPEGSWEDYQDEFYANGVSVVVRRENMQMQDEPLEIAIKETLLSSGVTTHAYISAGEAHALEPHVDPYDVFVIQAYGYKNWTVCHPLDTFEDFPNANQAQRAQLQQIAIAKNKSRAVASCDNFDPQVLLRTTNCQHFTLHTGDVLYLPKAVIHYATTDPGQVSAHLTISIDRDDRTWKGLVTTAALVTEHPAAGLVQEVLTKAENSPLGMPWYMLPSHDHTAACQQLTELVLGFEPWSLRSFLKHHKTWMSSFSTDRLLQQIGRCDNQLGEDLHGKVLTNSKLVSNTSTEVKQRQRRVRVTINCGNSCICRTCNGNSCDGSCDSSCNYWSCDSSCDSCNWSGCNGGCDSSCDSRSCRGSCDSSCDYFSCNDCRCRPGYYRRTTSSNYIRVYKCQSCPAGTYRPGETINANCASCPTGKYQNLATQSTCKNCNSGYFQNSNRQTSCKRCSTVGTICDAGERQSGCGSSSAGNCAACSTHQFRTTNRHRATSCITCGTCDKGEQYSCARTVGLRCPTCPPGTYQPNNGHRSGCSAQTTCGRGQRFSGTSYLVGFCQSCPEKTYQTSTRHRNVNCIAWRTCSAGQRFSGGSATSSGTCTNCGTGQFQDNTDHRLTSCKSCSSSGEACTAGQYLSGCGGASNGACLSCPTGTYQDATSHQATTCKSCKSCQAGYKLVGCGGNSQGTCVQCPDGTYRPATGSHRESTCLDCRSCSAGSYNSNCGEGSAGTCTACGTNTYQPVQGIVTKCTPCASCGSQQERTGCAGANPGSCIAKPCSALTVPTNGRLTYNPSDRRPTKASVVATLFCNPGYESDTTTVTCPANLQWSSTSSFKCTGVSCPSLTNSLGNGTVTQTSSIFPSTATHTCNSGYTLTGNVRRSCTTAGAWDGSAPQCVGLPCESPPRINKGDAVASNGGDYPSTVQYTCDVGYELVGKASSTCSATTLRWIDSAPRCDPRSCTAFDTPDNGAVEYGNGGKYPSVATSTCNAGYEQASGDVVRTCNAATGNYDGTDLTCQGRECASLVAPDNGAMDQSGLVRFPATVRYTCNAGYELVGTAAASCQVNGGWSSSAPTCKPCSVDTFKTGTAAGNKCIACPAFSSTNGQLAQSDCVCEPGYGYDSSSQKCVACPLNQFKADHGDVACQACPAGFEALQTGSSQCTGVPCETPALNNHSSVTTSNNNQHPSEATYVCDTGFALPTGDDGKRTCQSSSKWSAAAPVCSPICGDGLHVEGEECDDGVLGNSGCDDNCKLVEGYFCENPNELCTLCSLTTVAQDQREPCQEADTKRAAWVAANLGVVADDHPHCGTTTFTVEQLGLRNHPTCGEYEYRVNVTFSKGGSDSSVATFSTYDDVTPTYDNLPSPTTVECDSLPDGTIVTASDQCLADVNVSYQDSIIPGSCTGQYTLIRTWTARDVCNNHRNSSVIYSVADRTAPVINTPPAPLALECDGTSQIEEIQPWLDSAGSAVAVDACRSPVSWSTNYDVVKAGLTSECGSTGSAEVTFTASDDCSRTVTAKATITRSDTTKPYFQNFPINETYECTETPTPAPTVVGLDACDASPTVDFEMTRVNETCGHGFTLFRTWTVTDDCDFSVSQTQQVDVRDTQGPVFTSGPSVLYLECDPTTFNDTLATYIARNGNATAEDACGGAVMWNYTHTDFNSVCGGENGVGNMTITFSATDICGNTNSMDGRVVVVDTQSPELVNKTASLVVECDAVPAPEDIAVVDQCDPSPDVVFTDGREDGRCRDEYTLYRYIDVKDHCGNGDNHTQNVSVIDTKPPTLIQSPQTQTDACDGQGNEAGLAQWLATNGNATAEDSCGGQVTWTSTYNSSTSRRDGCSASYTVFSTFIATDECGNDISTSVAYMAADNEAPEFTGVPADLEFACKDPTLPHAGLPAVPNVTSFDACDRQAYNVSFEETSAQGRCPQELFYNRSWTVQDECGNLGIAVQRLHIVDYVPPNITAMPQNLVVECDRGSHGEMIQSWLNSSGGAEAADECGTTVTWSHNLTDLTMLNASCSQIADVVVLFTASDECGNQVNATATLLITDTTPPLVSKEPVPLELECNIATNKDAVTAWLSNAANAEAFDQCTKKVNITSTITAPEPICASSYSQEAMILFTDDCGLSTNVTSQITVQDSSVPVITLAGPNPQQTEAGFEWVDPWITSALDDCEGDITNRTTQSSAVDVNILGPQPVIYQVVDACGLVGNTTRTVNVVDTLPPRVVAPAVTVFRLRAGTKYQPPSGITATDSFDGDIESSAIRFEPTDFENVEGVHSIFAVAKDDSGNAARVPVQTVYVLPQSPADAGEAIDNARLELNFDTNVAVRNAGKPAKAVALYIRFDSIRSSEEVQQFFSQSLGTSGYPLPYCLPVDGHSFCRIDTPELSASMLDSLASKNGVVALSSKGMPVQDYQLGVPNPDGRDIEVLQSELQRVGADSATSLGCDLGFCRFSVSRQEVTNAVPVARPHPHSRFVMDSDGQTPDQIEAELLAAGLMPLAVQVSSEDSTHFVVDVPDYVDDNVLSNLDGVVVNLKGEIQRYFRMTFNLTITEDAAPWTVYQALFTAGLAPETVESHDNGVFVITTATSVYNIMLEELADDSSIKSVTPVQPVEETQKLVEPDFPFTYILDINLDLDETPDVNATVTPQNAAEQITKALAEGQRATVLCSSADGRRGNCQMRSSFELTTEQLKVTRGNNVIVSRFVIDDDNSRQGDIEAASEEWIDSVIGGADVNLIVKASLELTGDARRDSSASYTVVSTFATNEVKADYRSQTAWTVAPSATADARTIEEAIYTVVGASDVASIEGPSDNSTDYTMTVFVELAQSQQDALTASEAIEALGYPTLLPASLTANDAVDMLRQEIKRRYVEIDVQGFTMLAVEPAAIRGTPYVAPARPTTTGAPSESSSSRSGGSSGGMIGGAVAGAVILIVVVAVLVSRRRKESPTSDFPVAKRSEGIVNPLCVVNPVYEAGDGAFEDDEQTGEYSDVGGNGFTDAPDGLYSELDADFNEPATAEDPYGDDTDLSDDDAYGEEEGYLDVGAHGGDDEEDLGGFGSDMDDGHDDPEDSYLAVDGEEDTGYGFDDARALENPLYDEPLRD
eukprot:m.292733 g.292733  ORF g.292733 m.292733 type:complete len:3199 (-) comp17828_c0_seq1:4442-14038(-)